jgi:hypothetical protein
MITLRPGSERGGADHGWLKTRHTFSFNTYHDPAQMRFRALRVINEDWIAPGQGFGTHPHDNMEIITYVLEGALEHQDSLGTGSIIRPGDAQRMSAGTGIRHSEYNASKTDEVHMLQIWIMPNQRNVAPGYEQKVFPAEDKAGKLRAIAAPDGRDGAVTIHADTSLYHGYISGGKVYNSTGTVKDSSLMDSNATTTNSVNVNTYTPVFMTGASVKGVKLCRMWNHDIVRYADGTIAVLGQGRADNCTGTPSGSDPDKRMIYSRFDGTSWKTTYLVKACAKLYAAEEDYTGLSALDPDDPHTIYISTPYDPRDDTTMSAKREIWRGTTCDNGATFTWTQVTARSTADNIRPIIPKWDASHTALLWMNGTYTSAQSYAMKVVGLIGPKN